MSDLYIASTCTAGCALLWTVTFMKILSCFNLGSGDDSDHVPAEMSPRQGYLKNSESGLTEDCKPGVAVKEESAGHTGKSVAEDHKPPSGLKPKKKSGLAGKRSALGTLRPPALTIPNRDSETGSAEAEVRIAQAMQRPSSLLTGFLTACPCDDLIADDASGAGQIADD